MEEDEFTELRTREGAFEDPGIAFMVGLLMCPSLTVLVGLGIGSVVGSELARRVAHPRIVFGWCQLLLCATLAWAAYATGTLPFWPINPSLSTSPVFMFQLDLMRAIWVMLPSTILWGASFPRALGAVALRGQDPGRLGGGVYAANTVGAVAGSLAMGFFLLPRLGSHISLFLLVVAGGVLSLWLSAGAGRRAACVQPSPSHRRRRRGEAHTSPAASSL